MFISFFFGKKFAVLKNSLTFASVLKTASRGGAVVARWAHNPKAGGSIPSPATFEENASSPLFIYVNCNVPANQNRF